MRGECLLDRYGGGDGVAGAWKGDEEAIALRIDFVAMMCLKKGAQQLAILREHIAIARAEALEQLRGAFDIGEEQRDGATRQVYHIAILQGGWQLNGLSQLYVGSAGADG